MDALFFINEIGYKFNLRKPKSEKPTNVYFVTRVKNKQIKRSTGVKNISGLVERKEAGGIYQLSVD